MEKGRKRKRQERIKREVKECEEKAQEVNGCGGKGQELAVYVAGGQRADGWSLHLALREKDGWQPLNAGIGVLYAEADFTTAEFAGTTRIMRGASAVRTSEGDFRVSAPLAPFPMPGADASGIVSPDTREQTETVCCWRSSDLVHFERQQDGGLCEWRLEGERRQEIAVGENKFSACILELTEEESGYLRKKLGRVENTTAALEADRLCIKGGELFELPWLLAHYSDGSAGRIPVKWDAQTLKKLTDGVPGSYMLHGEAQAGVYPVPLVAGVADPMIRFFRGKYYMVGTNEYTEGRGLQIRCAETVAQLAEAQPVCFFEATPSGEHSGCNWAPELHVIGGELYCLFASSLTGRWNAVQSRIMHCKGDPMLPESWEPCVRVCKRDGSNLIGQGITLDMTYFEAAGKSYYCWAQRDIVGENIGTSDLYIARVEPHSPQRLLTEPVRLLTPKYAWDRQHTTVDEGPHVLHRDGRLYLTFSGDSVSDDYCMGLLTADEGADLLDPSVWEETGYPVLARQHVAGERGPGHNAFTKDEYGRDLLVYHMKPDGGTRSGCVRVVHYGFDGTPLFDLTPERYLRPEYREVTLFVTVGQ